MSARLILAAPLILAALLSSTAASAQARDKWGYLATDWTNLRLSDFLERGFDYRGRSKELIEAARANDPKAMILIAIGIMHKKLDAAPGVDTTKLLPSAAAQGYPFADYLFAFYALHPAKRQPGVYLRYLRKAADAGHRAARQRLATEYLDGRLVPQDIAKARSLLQHEVPELRQAAKYHEAMILLYHAPDEQRNRLKGSELLFELINDEDHAVSKLTWSIYLDATTVSKHLKDRYEVVGYSSQPENHRIVSYDNELCYAWFYDANKVRYPWEWAGTTLEASASGELKFKSEGQTIHVRPLAAVDPAALKDQLAAAQRLNSSCSKFTPFLDEDRYGS